MNNSRNLSRLALAALACASLSVGCNRDKSAVDTADTSTTAAPSQSTAMDTSTTSSTTESAPPVAAVPPPAPAAVDESESSSSAMTSDSTSSEVAESEPVAPEKVEDSASKEEPAPALGAVVTDETVIEEDTTEDTIESTTSEPDVVIEEAEDVDTYGAIEDEEELLEEDTASGATMEEDTMIVGTESVSTDELERSLRHSALNPFYQEPGSRTPIQIGSTTITGKDKNIAALEAYNVFIDPAARERKFTSRNVTQPIADLNFGRYGYDNRSAFKSDMNARLSLIDMKVNDVRQTSDMATDSEEFRDQLARVDQAQRDLQGQAGVARGIRSEEWESYRSDFRDKLASLEQDVARLDLVAR
ncbi:MAG TPA: hypothetical protein VM432_00245 [Bdellovibrionales bacterium]|nr:hypothetical protein [Bdellovibrionales bacterium]